MILSLYIIASMLVAEMLIILYAIIRNEWVYRERRRILFGPHASQYALLPRHTEMTLGHGFWKWNIEYYLSTTEQK